MKRLWDRDASLWTGDDESKWLGWLDIVEEQTAQHDELHKLAKEVHIAASNTFCLLGMGGSSLCPEVLRMTFGRIPQFPNLHVLDSTDPAQVKSFEHQIDIAKTLFIVSSKSGSTLEPNIFKQYFFERTKQTVGATNAGKPFHRDHRSGIEDAASRRRRSFSAHFLRSPVDRRSLFGAIEFWHGSGCGDGARYEEVSGPRGGDGAGLRTGRKRRRKSRSCVWHHSWKRGESWPRQSHDHYFSGNL